MKKFYVFILFLMFADNSYASTIASRFAEQQYAFENCLNKVHIVVKNEHTTYYNRFVEHNDIQAISYGYGDMKIKGCKKLRILYICLLDKNFKPIKSFIISEK